MRMMITSNTDRHTNYQSLIKSLAVIMLCSVMAGCGSGDLSKRKATAEIKAVIELPEYEEVELQKVYFEEPVKASCRECRSYESKSEELEAWREEGLIRLETEEHITGRYNDITQILHHVILTEVGADYLIREEGDTYFMRSHSLAFEEVTGIITNHEEKSAKVDFTISSRDATPFASSDSRVPVEMKAYFTNYDDGWRLDKQKTYLLNLTAFD